MSPRPKACAVADTGTTCGRPHTHFVFVDFLDYAVPYRVCRLHHEAVERGEGLSFQLRGLIVGWKAGTITTETTKPIRKDLL